MTFEDHATLPATTGFYAAGTLYKIVSTNASGSQVIEFRDLSNRLILRKVQLDDVPGPAHRGWICTYNIYNSRGLLTAVLMPETVRDATLSAYNGPLVPQILFSTYLYRYDSKGRLVMERNPDTDSTEYVYDRDDRIVISFDGALKKYLMSRYFQYDSLNRVTTTGIGYAYPDRSTMQYIMNGATSELPFLPESYRLPQVRTYYDNYNYPGKLDYEITDINRTRPGSNADAETPPATPDSATTGQVTGRSVYVMATGQWLMTSYYYDHKGRVIQTLADNFPGGKDIINRLYDTAGHLLSTYQRHTNPQSTLTPQSTLLTMFHYDGNGRVDAVKKMLNDDESAMHTVALNTYGIDGDLINKRLDAHDDTQLESLDYEYTSGKLSGINKTYVTTAGSVTNWFGQEIDSTIGVKWKTRSDGIARAYDYSYDRVGRMLSANYTQQNGMSWTNDAADYSSTGMSYDLDGNVLSRVNRGMNGIVKKTIDDLVYIYDGFPFNSDRTVFLRDLADDSQSVLGDFKDYFLYANIFDYGYERNGNIGRDRNRQIDTILYDFNNLPTRFIFNGKATIDYVYDGLGNKLATVVLDHTGSTAVYRVDVYAGGFVYHNDTLQYVEHEEGRIRPIYATGQPVQYAYDYYVKDDKGSTRVVLSTEKDTSIYAATMETAGSGVENALFANIDNTRATKPSGYPVDNTTDPNTYVARLNGSSGQKIGPSLVLRVMAGDSVKMGVKAYYESSDANTSDNTPEAMVASLLSALNGRVIADGVHQATGTGSPVNTVFDGTVYNNLTNMDPDQNEPLQPKAYLNYILFDEQFNIVNENSGVRQVQGDANTLLTLVVAEQQLKKSGFLYIYTSNESAADVYFDNLIVAHTSGPLLEETHYYPFGLTMAGLSNQALKGSVYPKNRIKLFGKMFDQTIFNNGYKLELYHFGTRMFDPQTGRFQSPAPNGVVTPYGL
jgi:YD repeat-containing protein